MSTTVSPVTRVDDDHRTERTGDQPTGRRFGARHVFARLHRKPTPPEPPAIDWYAG
jgi:hypothetical protein